MHPTDPRHRVRGRRVPDKRTSSRLAADAMLGSLARKLRIFGFDTLYLSSLDDDGIIELLTNERRVLLTADRALASIATKRGIRVVVVEGKSDSERLRFIASRAGSLGVLLRPGASRCAICNGGLERTNRLELMGHVDSSLLSKHKAFFVCVECGKVYWKGKHWNRLRRLSGLIPWERI
jgi:uncharacterized protein with PIN domain